MKKKLEISAIRSQAQYQIYLQEVDKLMDKDPSSKSKEGQLLETLVVLIEDYERKKGWELPRASDPLHVIKLRMEELGLKQADLVEAMGDKTIVSRVLKGSRGLTYSMIAPLSQLLRIPPELLLKWAA